MRLSTPGAEHKWKRLKEDPSLEQEPEREGTDWQKRIISRTVRRESVCEGCPRNLPSFGEAFWVWVKVALNSFGGPTGQIAVMHHYLVEEKRWISESRFLHALNYCMLLPGPEAQQLAIYIGWLLHKIPGGVVAGTLFVVPGFLAMLVLSILYAGYQNLNVVQWLFFGLKPAVLAVVIEAVLRIGKRVLKNRLYGDNSSAIVCRNLLFCCSIPVDRYLGRNHRLCGRPCQTGTFRR